MVTPAGKELLKNTINTAKFHNKIIEENDMWRQWELEKGLTMMVSDDLIKKRSGHRCEYHEKKRKERLEAMKHRKQGQTSGAHPRSKAEALEKWDHSGFKELYPDGSSDESNARKRKRRRRSHSEWRERSPSTEDTSSSHRRKKRKKQRRSRSRRKSSSVECWDHSGFQELYPDKSHRCSSSSSSSSSSSLRHKKRSRHEKRHEEREESPLSGCSSIMRTSSSSDEEVKVEPRPRTESSSSSSWSRHRPNRTEYRRTPIEGSRNLSNRLPDTLRDSRRYKC